MAQPAVLFARQSPGFRIEALAMRIEDMSENLMREFELLRKEGHERVISCPKNAAGGWTQAVLDVDLQTALSKWTMAAENHADALKAEFGLQDFDKMETVVVREFNIGKVRQSIEGNGNLVVVDYVFCRHVLE
jgi:hypothetical protein